MGKDSIRKGFSSKVINASEIGQFKYCSVAWYLQKIGHKPNSEFINQGILKHKKLGETIENTKIDLRKSNLLNLIGYILVIIAIFILFFEVVI